jgi:hypothetical protein
MILDWSCSGTILEKIRIIPKKVLHHGHKLELILPPPMPRHVTGDKIVHYISKPWWKSVSNMHQLLIREGLRDGSGLIGEIHNDPRKMISHHIFGTLLVPNLYVKLLQH